MRISRIKIFFIIIFTVFILSEGLFLFVLPFCVNSKVCKNDFSSFLQKISGVNFIYEKLELKTYPDFSLKITAQKPEVTDKENTMIAKGDNFSLNVNLLPSIFKKLHIKSFSADNLNFVITRHTDNNLYFGHFVIDFPIEAFKKHVSKISNLNIKNSQIVYVDDTIGENFVTDISNAELQYKKNSSLMLRLESTTRNKNYQPTEFSIKFNSKLPLEKGIHQKDFTSTGYIKNLNISAIHPYICRFLQKEFVSSSGKLNANFNHDDSLKINVDIKDFKLTALNPLDSIWSDSDIKISSVVSFEPKTLLISDFVVHSNEWRINSFGHIKNYNSKDLKQVKPDLAIVVKNSSINSLYNLFPTLSDEFSEVIHKIKKYQAWGIADGEIKLKGSFQAPEIFGDLNVKDLRILNNTFDYPYSDLNVEFLNNIVKINTRIWIDKNEYVDVVGNSEMKLYGKGDFHIKSTKNVNLKKTLSWLVPIHDLIGFDIGPLPYMNLDGTGNIDINARGTILDGEIYGKLNFYNATAMLDGLSAIITGLDSSLFFDKKNITFKTNKAFLNKKLVKIDGTSNLDGKIDFDIVANSIKIEDLLNILNTSPILEPQKVLVQPLEKAIGEANATIKITGIVKDFSKIKDNTTLKISGKLKLKNVTAKVKDLLFELVNTVGFIEFNNVGWNLDVSGLVGKKSKVFIKGFASDKNVEVSVKSDSVLLSDVWEVLSKINKIEYLKNFPKTSSFVSFDAVYKTPYGLKANGFSLENLVANGKFKSLNKADVLNINQGTFFLNKGSLSLKDVGADFVTSKFFINAKIDKIFTQKPIINGKLKVDEYDVSNLNTIKQMNLLPTSLQNILVLYKDYSGRAAAQITCKNNYLDGIVELKNVKFTHVFFDTPVVIDSGKVVLDGTKIHLHSLVAQVDTIPVFINFSISDIDKTMKIDGYFTSKFNEYLANKYINSYLSYPIKPKGDITLTADISGTPDSVTIKPKIKLAQDADIYYMGANLGDESSQREIVGDINIVGNNYTIKRIDYVRFMTSQNSKIYPLKIITANGVIEQNTKDKSFVVKNLNVETLNNANAKIFNVFFKKSVLKKGMFNCKLNFSGNYKAPQINGVVSFDNISMPLYDTIIKNIVLKFHDKSIDVKASGDVYNSDIKITAVIKNSFNKPYVIESLVVKSDKLNLNNLIDALTDIPTPNTATKLVEHPQSNNLPFDISDIQLKKGMLEVKDILIKDLPASNFLSEFTLGKDFVLNISKLVFDITTGKMTGTASYDFRNGKIKANVSALKVDSNKIASSLFGFKEQIFGQANGNIVIMTTGNSEQERIKNMAGFVYFEISDGKMPKLGSVEYLLKAGNFIKNGITGASLNNLIELLNPVKTGQFDSIKGKLALKNGVAQDIEIYSKGDNLNLFINGEFDILQQYANMRIMGRLTQKASGVLGPVGNLSLNSLLNSIPGIRLSSREKELLVNDLNKIPGAESSDQKYRLFTVKVDGNINDDKFVKNFRWIE